MLSEAVLVINEVVIVIEKSTAQIDYEHDYDYAHDSQNSASYLSGICDSPLTNLISELHFGAKGEAAATAIIDRVGQPTLWMFHIR